MASRLHVAPTFAALGFLCVSLLPTTAAAENLPRSWKATPGVYRVLAEDEQFQLISVTWKPGQRDLAHSHPAAGVYFLTDCTLRAYGPDGSVQGEVQRYAGFGQVQPPVAGHSIENVGSKDCRLIMFEPR